MNKNKTAYLKTPTRFGEGKKYKKFLKNLKLL